MRVHILAHIYMCMSVFLVANGIRGHISWGTYIYPYARSNRALVKNNQNPSPECAFTCSLILKSNGIPYTYEEPHMRIFSQPKLRPSTNFGLGRFVLHCTGCPYSKNWLVNNFVNISTCTCNLYLVVLGPGAGKLTRDNRGEGIFNLTLYILK